MLLILLKGVIVIHIITLQCNDVSGHQSHFCNDVAKHFVSSNSSSMVYLLGQRDDQYYGCVDGSISLSCCMTRYSHIVWQMSSVEEYRVYDMWRPLALGTNSSHHLDNNNQTLTIDYLKQDDHHKYYRCIGYGIEGQQLVDNVFKLNVQDCSKFNQSTFLQPTSLLTTRPVVLGYPVQLKCSLYTEDNSTEVHLHWYREKMSSNSTSTNHSDVPLDGRFLEITDRDPEGHVENSFLIINSTEPEDFNWYYICYTSLDMISEGERRIQLIIEDELAEHVVHVVVLTIIALATVSMAIAVVVCRFQVEICLFYKTRIQKTRRLEGVENHIFLLHSNESHNDRMFTMNVIRPFLQDDLKYRVFSEADFTLGQDFLDHSAEGLQNSHVMVVIVSRDLLEDESCLMLIRDALSSGHRIVYIIREPVSCDTESLRDILEAIRVGKKVTWLREDDEQVSAAECRVLCSFEPENQPCRETNSIDYCRRKLQLYLLQLLEDRSHSVAGWVLQKGHSLGTDSEQNPIVSMDFMSRAC